MEEENPRAAEIIGRLLDLMENHIVELAAQATVLQLLSEFWPSDEPIDWKLLVDSEKKDIAQSVSDRFEVIRAVLLEGLAKNHPQLPVG
ncbi:MAG: hypothetical protein WA802_08690, partial [Terracidiphilus sp.]